MNFSRLLASRYLNPARSHVSVITLISLVGVMLGVAVLIIVLSVHAGFERDVKTLLLGFSPHIEVKETAGFVEDWDTLQTRLKKVEGVAGSYALIQDIVLVDAPGYRSPVGFRAFDTQDQGQIEALTELLDTEGYPGSRADIGLDEYAVISRQLAQDLFLTVGDSIEVYASRNFDVVKEEFERTNAKPLKVLKEVEIGELQVRLKELTGQLELPISELQSVYGALQDLLVGAEGAREGEVDLVNGALIAIESQVEKDEAAGIYRIENRLWSHLTEALQELRAFDVEGADAKGLKNLREIVLPKKLKVWGVYGDSQRTPGPQMFVPLPVGQELTGLTAGVQAVAVRVDNPFVAWEIQKNIDAALDDNYVSVTWMDRHQAQFALIRTERLMMTFALSFIGLISAFSIMAVMYTITIQKRQEIGVMKALGATGRQISWVFLWQGLVVGFFGAIGGVLLALLVIWQRVPIQKALASVGFDPFPADFQGFSELPARIMPGFMVTVALAAWVLCGLAALFPALKAAKDDPAKSLRNL